MYLWWLTNSQPQLNVGYMRPWVFVLGQEPSQLLNSVLSGAIAKNV
jgi:hypothetical protein